MRSFPTPVHREAAEAVVEFAKDWPVRAVLLVNSYARGVATPQSDVDVALLVDPGCNASEIEQAWLDHYAALPVFRDLKRLGPFACVHLDVFDGQWSPQPWDDGGGPDAFEIEIGNRVAHAFALYETGPAFSELCGRWLPYYCEDLQDGRLRMVRAACEVGIERAIQATDRGLHFYALDRLYHSFQEFLQALFIRRAVYPIAYNKWIEEQVSSWLGLPDLYCELVSLFEIPRLESATLRERAHRLRAMLEKWTT